MKKTIRGMSVITLCAASLLASQFATAHEGYGRHEPHDRRSQAQVRHAHYGQEHRDHRQGRRAVERRVIVEQPQHAERRSDNGNIAAGLVLGGILGALIASQMGGH